MPGWDDEIIFSKSDFCPTPLYNQQRLPVDTLLTDVITLDDINEGFDRLDRGEAARLVVKMPT
ncbi:hypothetical protein [Staphylococcus arlettae]|uniref:hypothetical protein n=1 Tax=Staphylococcus arlettae TaxID=29378 RepID=UPI0036F231FA